ncbi:MAG: phosphoribosylaminoimidazolesuccinocarboxamide synthase, partial [Gemmatimonadaceae bacterium]
TAVATTALPLARIASGKVRDVYAIDAERILLVATDRVSAFDVVMREAVPHKGAVLTQLSAWWLGQLDGVVRHHLLASDAAAIVDQVPALRGHVREIAGRAMLCRRASVFPVECVIRGYITGSAWKEYAARGTLAGEALPAGLRESDRLEPPIFSPATKADVGHDENITVARMRAIIGDREAMELERSTRAVYDTGRRIAEPKGIIIADTKFEFGRAGDGEIMLIDEVLTPDSSRFWPADRYEPGHGQPSFDKQPLRDYLDGERRAGRWNGDAPPPPLPDAVVAATSARYLDAFRRLTGHELPMETPS